MFKTRKAQAAMEFLMTYGWAILVVLAAIAALAYFGVLSPDRFLPEQCTLPSGVACLDFTVTGNASNPQFNMIVQNSAGFDMSTVSVNLTTPPAGASCTATVTPATLTDGAQDTFDIDCTGASAGKFKSDIVISYTNLQTGLAHTKVGTLIAEVS
ncbi:hypothetical protein ACFL96_07660 [Thermoproteota archaeon]